MATGSQPDNVFYGVYDEYIGDPGTKPEVYGYWILLVGLVAVLTGGALSLVGRLVDTGVTPGVLGEASIVLAASGGVVLLLGLVLQLPLRRRAIMVAVFGALTALAAVALFVALAPGIGPLVTAERLAVAVGYGGGVGLVVLVAALVPVATGRRCLLLDAESPEPLSWTVSEEKAELNVSTVMLGESTRDGVFAVFPTDDGWRWRFVEQTAVADGQSSFESETAAESALDGVKGTVADAGLLELNAAAIRLYRGDEANVRWALVDADGVVLADSDGRYADREKAENAVNLLKEHGPGAALLDVDDGAFEVYGDGSAWRWRLVDEDRGVLGVGPTEYEDRTEAEAAVLGVRETAQAAPSMDVEHLGFELRADEDGWYWRLLDAADTTIAVPTERYPTEEAATESLGRIADGAIDMPFLTANAPGYEITEAEDGGWCWRLVDGDDEVVARSEKAVPSEESGRSVVGRVKDVVTDARVATLDDAEFEVYTDGDDWDWRLVTADRQTVAHSPQGASYGTAADAEAAVDRVRTEVGQAERMSFDSAAFHLYEGEEGAWNWRLVDADGRLVSDSGREHASREDAASAMSTMKEHAPEADLVEIESPALECYQADGEWHWRLVDANGETLATSPGRHDTAEAAHDAMDTLELLAPEADARTMDAALFQVHVGETEPRQWRWRLVHPDGTTLATSTAGFSGQAEATAAAETVAEYAAEATVHTITDLAVRFTVEEVETDEEAVEPTQRWHWEVVDRDRTPLAVGTEQFPSRDAVAGTAGLVRDHARGASVFEVDPAAYRLEEIDDGWRWRLVDADRTTLAVGAQTHGTREDAGEDRDRVRDLASGAGLLDFDLAAFEVVRRESGWVWRFVDTSGTVIGVSAQSFGTEAAAERALADVRDLLTTASMLDIESPAFELHVEDGEWRWQLVDTDGSTIAESMRTYPTRREAREAMGSLRTFGPDAATESHP